MNNRVEKMMQRLLVASSFILVMTLSGCAGALIGDTQSGGYQGSAPDRSHAQISEDGAISANIRSNYHNDAVLSTADIRVSTYNNVVSLYGQVASRRLADRAVSIARAVKGVSQVVSKVAVAP